MDEQYSQNFSNCVSKINFSFNYYYLFTLLGGWEISCI